MSMQEPMYPANSPSLCRGVPMIKYPSIFAVGAPQPVLDLEAAAGIER
jgi:hypothetical protein